MIDIPVTSLVPPHYCMKLRETIVFQVMLVEGNNADKAIL